MKEERDGRREGGREEMEEIYRVQIMKCVEARERRWYLILKILIRSWKLFSREGSDAV